MNAPVDPRVACLDAMLQDWARWLGEYVGTRGYSNHSVLLQSERRVGSTTFDEIANEIDDWVCEMVDSAVGDLSPGQKAAIDRCYGLAAVFRFPRGNYADLLSDAKTALLISLPKKGVVFWSD